MSVTEVVVDFAFESIELDRSSPVPLYYQLAQQLEKAIEDGGLTTGMRMANELDLAERLGVSRPTTRRAMEYLVGKGLIVRRRGIGTSVVSPRVRRSLELTSLFDDLSRSGQKPTTRVLSLSLVPATGDVSQALNVPEGAEVIHIDRIRSAMDQPIARLINYVPTGIVELTGETLESRGLYQLFRGAGVHLHSATQRIGSRTATTAEAKLLKEARGAALLTMGRTSYDDRGSPVEFGTHIYAASRYSFEMSLLSP